METVNVSEAEQPVAPEPEPMPAITEAEPPAIAAPIIVEREKRSPFQWIGLDHGRTGEYEYVRGSRGDRVVNRDGAAYEHCADDLDGCWLYGHAHI